MTITLFIAAHKGRQRMFASFDYDKKINSLLKTIPGATWSNTKKKWHLEPNRPTLLILKEKIGTLATIDYSLLKKYVPSTKPRPVTTLIQPPQTQPSGSLSSNERPLVSTQITPANTGIIPSGTKAVSVKPVSKNAVDYPLWKTHQVALGAYIEMLRLKNYSENTVKTYRNWFIFFLKQFPERKPSTVSKAEIMDFLVRFRKGEKWSSTSQNQLINAIKFFYEKLLQRPREVYDLPRAKKEFKLPTVFSENELINIIKSVENIKHRAMICLAYSVGLRISEIVALKMVDIDKDRMVITLRGAKGKKDRQVMLSAVLLELLRTYYKMEKQKPKVWLFEGQYGGQYSTRSIEEIMKKAKRLAGVKKKGSIHAIRHSFATHLMEGGTDIMTIKELLGHNSLRTTSIYTHVSKKQIAKVQSPLDKLNL